MNAEFAKRAILLMWLGAVGVVTYKEFGNDNNPGRPLPRPCKLYPAAIGYTGLGFMAEFLPSVTMLVALGITIGEVVFEGGIAGGTGTILSAISGSIDKTTAQVRKTP